MLDPGFNMSPYEAMVHNIMIVETKIIKISIKHREERGWRGDPGRRVLSGGGKV